MRIIGFILLITAAFTSAQIRVMHIYMKDTTMDSIYCCRIDTAVGVAFSKTKMTIGVVDTGDNGKPVHSVRWYCTGLIDSITFETFSLPSEEQASNAMPRQKNQRLTAHETMLAIIPLKSNPGRLRAGAACQTQRKAFRHI